MAISTAIDATAVARVVGIKTEFVNLRGGNIVYLPQRIAVFAQGNSAAAYSTTKLQVTSASQAAKAYGFGSPIHLAVSQLLPSNGDGVGTIPVTVYPLEDGVSAITAAGDITPVGTVTKAGVGYVTVNNNTSQAFSIPLGASVADIVENMETAINAVLDMLVIASDDTTKLDLTAKWAGPTGNGIHVEVSGAEETGITFAVTQLADGAVNPSITSALAQVGDVWETFLLNCLNVEDEAILDEIQTWGVGRWGATTKKPIICSFVGNTATTVEDAITVSSTRRDDYVNGQLVAPGSTDLPFVVAARQLARIAPMAQNNPPHDYGRQTADGITPGTDGEQWDYIQRNQAVSAGSSTVEVRDGVIDLSDTVTFYHPEGDPTPSHRFVVDIVKIANILFNINLIFSNDNWDGAPLIPDDQPTTNRTAKKPKMAIAEMCTMIDNLGLAAIISDPTTAKANTFAGINSQNPKRLDVASTMQVSGNSNIISVDFNWGFYFGTDAVVA